MCITANQFPKRIIKIFQFDFKPHSTGSHCFPLFHQCVKIYSLLSDVSSENTKDFGAEN